MFIAYVNLLPDGCYLVEFGTAGRNGRITNKHIYHTEEQATRAKNHYEKHGNVRQAREEALTGVGVYENLIKIW